jgi:hypothetical protein
MRRCPECGITVEFSTERSSRPPGSSSDDDAGLGLGPDFVLVLGSIATMIAVGMAVWAGVRWPSVHLAAIVAVALCVVGWGVCWCQADPRRDDQGEGRSADVVVAACGIGACGCSVYVLAFTL